KGFELIFALLGTVFSANAWMIVPKSLPDERKKQIIRSSGADVLITDDLDAALQGADFVVTQIRVGKLPARHLDETIPLKYGLIGQETTGIGGFFKALRTIPVMQNICDRIEAVCPDAWLINFTNPSGIISEFIQNFTKVKNIGLCNVPINMIDDTRETAGADSEITYLGLNHLSWITSVKVDGINVLPKMMAEGFSTKVMENIVDDGFSMECLKTISAVPSSYLQYFYGRTKKLEHLQSATQSRAEECMEIEEQLLEMYADEKLIVKPALLDKRGGHKYSLAAVSLIDAIANNTKTVNVVNIKNGKTLPFMDENDVVEIAAEIGQDGAAPVPVECVGNRHIIGLMRVVKEYEKYTVKAAMSGSVEDAMNALLIQPLIGDWDKASECFEEMKQAHKKYLPQFK
ncbi:MAG: 6-phospho-beta-glucosidase, partial [Clostridiales bacterium]|nr:6-phospho-beta-glucosidase [Clostridiales bacterium]